MVTPETNSKALNLLREIKILNNKIYNLNEDESTISGLHIRKTIKKKPLEYKRAALIKELINIYPIHNSKKHLLKHFDDNNLSEELTPGLGLQTALEDLTYPTVIEVSSDGRWEEGDKASIYLTNNLDDNNLKSIMRRASGTKKNYNSKHLRAITRHKRRKQTRHKRRRQSRRKRKNQTRRRRKRKTT